MLSNFFVSYLGHIHILSLILIHAWILTHTHAHIHTHWDLKKDNYFLSSVYLSIIFFLIFQLLLWGKFLLLLSVCCWVTWVKEGSIFLYIICTWFCRSLLYSFLHAHMLLILLSPISLAPPFLSIHLYTLISILSEVITPHFQEEK